MLGFPHGLNRALQVVVGGLILALTIRAVLDALGYKELIVLFNLLSITLIILLFQKMHYWSISYLIGWIAGLMAFCLILEPWEIILYIVVTIIILFIKIRRKI
jgi:hypothetical protein